MAVLNRKEKKELQQNAVRKCSDECYFFKNGGTGCQYYRQREVKHGDSCLHDMIHVKSYLDAFANGDLEFVKGDAATITAMLSMQIRRMLEQITIEGVTINELILDAKGQPVWIPDPNWKPGSGLKAELIPATRIVDHPLIQRCIQLARSMGINLGDFKLTPKSADEKRAVSGHVIAENPEEVKKVMSDREAIEQRFVDAMKVGTQMTQNDPIYKQLAADGEIVG